MPSTVGNQRTDAEVVNTAAQLEFDCMYAYEEAAKRAHHPPARDVFSRLATKSQDHLQAWQDRLAALGQPPATRNRVTAPLNRLKVQLASPFGDGVIVRALTNNAIDSIEAYDRVSHKRKDLPSETAHIAEALLHDAEEARDAVAGIKVREARCEGEGEDVVEVDVADNGAA